MKEIFALLDADGSGNIDPKVGVLVLKCESHGAWLQGQSEASHSHGHMARSSLYEPRLVAVHAAVERCSVPDVDWPSFYTSGSAPGYVGPVELEEVPGKGLGLVATERLELGRLILVETSFALASAEPLPAACAARLRDSSEVQRAAFWSLSGEVVGRRAALRRYLGLQQGEVQGAGAPQMIEGIVQRNGRRTEYWSPWSLLLEEARCRAGLWLAASLFNHGCMGNVAITYGPEKAWTDRNGLRNACRRGA